MHPDPSIHIPPRCKVKHWKSNGKGRPPDEHDSPADFEIDYKADEEEGEVTMKILFDEVERGYLQVTTLHLDPRSAREVAYLLLMAANNLE